MIIKPLFKKPKRTIKKRYIAYGLFFSYLIMCQSCMKMRMSEKQTTRYFEKSQTAFVDKTVMLNNIAIHYIETGKKDLPTLFFVHGSPGSWEAFKAYLKDSLLLKKYRMVAVDRPGFGYSNFGEAQDLETQSDRIADFLKHIDNKKPVILVGHSLGGPVVVKIAAEHKNFVQQIVVLSGSVDPNAETPEKWRPVLKAVPFRFLIPGALRPSNDELWWLKNDLVVMKKQLKNINCAVTVIHGTKDRLVPFSNVLFMKNSFVNAKSLDIIAIENADHFIPWTHFEIVRNALLALKL